MKGDDSLALWGRVGPVDLLTGPPVRVDLMVEEARFVGPLAPSVYKTWGDSMNLADVDSVVGSVGPGAQLASAGLLPSWQPPSDDPSFASSPRRPSEPIMVTFRVTIPFTPARLVSTPTGQGDLGSFRERIQRSTPAMLPLPKRRRSARHGSPVRRSKRLAQRFRTGSSIKRQQRLLISKLGIAGRARRCRLT